MKSKSSKLCQTAFQANRGVTLVELMIVLGLTGMSLALASVAMVGMMWNLQNNAEVIKQRGEANQVINSISRYMREATAIENDAQEGVETTYLKFWRDIDPSQPITPNTTADDVQSIIYFNAYSHEVYLVPDSRNTSIMNVMATNVENLVFKWYYARSVLSMKVSFTKAGPGQAADGEQLNNDKVDYMCSFCLRNLYRT